MDQTVSRKSNRRGGRPRATVGANEDDLIVRQQKNREAQQLFRDRKQAAVREEQRHMVRLEESVNRMYSVLLELTDGLMARDSIQRDAGAMQLLRDAIQTSVSAAKDQEDLPQAISTPPTSVSGPCIPGGGDAFDCGHLTTYEANQPRETSQEGRDNPCTRATWSGRDSSNSRDGLPWPSDTLSAWAVARSHTAEPKALISPLEITNVFGNGWTDLPALYTMSLQRPSIEPPQDSLALQIIRVGFGLTYESLLNDLVNPDALWRSVFGRATEKHSREELLYTSRWYLGPGSPELFRLVGVMVIKGVSFNPGLSLSLDPSVDLNLKKTYSSGMWEEGPEDGDRLHISALEVENYLVQRGVRRVSPGVLEVFPASRQCTQAGFLNTDVFFPEEQTQSRSQPEQSVVPEDQPRSVLRISEDLFLRKLSGVAVCLSQGPTYPRNLLDSVIKAAAIE